MVDVKEPLLGGEKNQRIVASPAMRIAVRERLAVQQRADFLQILNDRGVRLEDVLPFPIATGENAAAVDRRHRLEAVLIADHEILVAVTWRGMHQAGARIGRDMRPIHQLHIAIEKRMAKDIFPIKRLEILARERNSLIDR